MKIGVDGRELSGHPTGVGRYLYHLCEQWTMLPAASDSEIVVYSPAPLAAISSLGEGATDGARLVGRIVVGGGGTRWEQTALADAANDDGLDVFFGPAYSLPLRLTGPGVVTLHDISYIAHPEWFDWREGFRRRWLARRSASLAETVITVSEFCRRELVDHLDLDPSQVRVVYNGTAAPVGAGPDHLREPLILYVGALFNRRHLPTLIAAFARVVRHVPAAQLVIVGPDRTHPHQDLTGLAVRAGVSTRVAFHPYVDDDELATLYRRATVFAFLSEYEGFGLTPLEALAAGVPALVGDTAVGREIYGDAVRFVPVSDVDAVARALVEIITTPAVRRDLLARADPVLARFTWSRAATETLEVLRVAAETRS